MMDILAALGGGSLVYGDDFTAMGEICNDACNSPSEGLKLKDAAIAKSITYLTKKSLRGVFLDEVDTMEDSDGDTMEDDGGDHVTFEAFKAWYLESEEYQIDNAVRRIFGKFDKNHSGTLESSEIKHVLMDLGHKDHDEIRNIINEMRASKPAEEPEKRAPAQSMGGFFDNALHSAAGFAHSAVDWAHKQAEEKGLLHHTEDTHHAATREVMSSVLEHRQESDQNLHHMKQSFESQLVALQEMVQENHRSLNTELVRSQSGKEKDKGSVMMWVLVVYSAIVTVLLLSGYMNGSQQRHPNGN
jgi:hypothetical protein